MADSAQSLASQLKKRFDADLDSCVCSHGEVTVEVGAEKIKSVCRTLRDESPFRFEILIDLCGVDYMEYGNRAAAEPGRRFAVVYHLLSVSNNQRLRVRAFLNGEPPRIDTVVDLWPSANWYEREAFDLFGILFNDHPDLRRLLTDYGFIGHPFRKDFPLIGNVEMRYDPELKRVVYQPVTIEPRINVPRVIREDHRYMQNPEEGSGGHG